jgi:arylformamidase
VDAWRSWPRERLEREYSPSSVLDSIEPFVRAYRHESLEALRRLPVRRDVRYGPGSDDRLDLAPAGPDAPLLVFFHGGYWQELGKADSLFPAPGLVADGIAYAAVEYTLAPRAGLDQIVDQARRSVAFLAGNAPALGFDGRRIHLGGHSAGAQLAAMAMLTDWERVAGLAPGFVAGGVLVSGVYDLEPLLGTYINEALGLDVAAARRNSPLLLCGAGAGGVAGRRPALAPAIVSWGEIEPSEFGRQGRDFATAWAAAGGLVDELEVRGRNHFDILFDLAQPTTELGVAVRRQVLGPGGPAKDG